MRLRPTIYPFDDATEKWSHSRDIIGSQSTVHLPIIDFPLAPRSCQFMPIAEKPT